MRRRGDDIFFGSGGMPVGVGGAIGPALPDSLLWHGAQPVLSSNTITDLVSPARVSDAEYVGVNCLEFDGTGASVVIPTLFDDITVQYGDMLEVSLITKDWTTGNALSTWAFRDDGGFQLRWNSDVSARLYYIDTAFSAQSVVITNLDSLSSLSQLLLCITPGETDGSVYLYQNGNLVYSSTGLSIAEYTGSRDVYIGAGGVNGSLTASTVGLSVDGEVIGSYPLSEGYGPPQDVSGNGNHATANTATWTTADGIPSHNTQYGHTPELNITAAAQFAVTGITTSSVITVDGTSTPTAGTGTIDLSIGTCKSITVDGTLQLFPLVGGELYDRVNSEPITSTSGTLVTKYIPALTDGSGLDAEGNQVAWKGCVENDYDHNNSEVGERHTDAQVSAYVNLWSDGASFLDVYYADYRQHVSGSLLSYLKWVEDEGNCYLKRKGLYADGTEFTIAEDAKNQRYWKQGDCGAGWGAVYDEDGTLLINLDESVEYDSI